MTTIISGSVSKFTVKVQTNGAPVPLDGSVTARVFSMDGRVELVPQFSLDESAAGAAWETGVAAVELSAPQTSAVPAGDAMLILAGGFGVRRYRLTSEPLFEGTRTSLFIRDIVVDEIRNDRLMAAAAGVLQDFQVSDAYIWDKVRSAESEIAHTLRVPLVPTRYFPIQPSQAELDALDGMAWEIDPGYDYDPTMWERDKWGTIVTRARPIISVEYLRFAYPTQEIGFFDIPLDWLRIDARAGVIRTVPSSPAMLNTMSGLFMSNLSSQRSIPSMQQLAYTAGLQNVATTYPELLDVIKKKAVVKMVGDAMLPQSGSISADGLSQSMSVDLDKYSAGIDEVLNGPKGSNGGLMTKIHGIRLMVI